MKLKNIILALTLATIILSPVGNFSVHAQSSNDKKSICESNPEFFGVFESGIIPGSKTICSFISSYGDNSLVVFAKIVINLVTGVIVAIGLISIVIGGYYYLTSGGSSDRISSAKSYIVSALLGIILALASWLILNTISSQFTNPEIPLPSPQAENN